MDAYTIHDAAERLEALVERAEAGESVDIARQGRVVARLVPVTNAVRPAELFDLAAYFDSIKNMPVYTGNSVVDLRKEARY